MNTHKINQQLEQMKQLASKKTDIFELIEHHELFTDVYCMLRDLSVSYSEIQKIEFRYVKGENIALFFAGEHHEQHYISDDYEEAIPPIIRVFDGIEFLGNDGNHRCNTCHFHNLNLPVVLIQLKIEN